MHPEPVCLGFRALGLYTLNQPGFSLSLAKSMISCSCASRAPKDTKIPSPGLFLKGFAGFCASYSG